MRAVLAIAAGADSPGRCRLVTDRPPSRWTGAGRWPTTPASPPNLQPASTLTTVPRRSRRPLPGPRRDRPVIACWHRGQRQRQTSGTVLATSLEALRHPAARTGGAIRPTRFGARGRCRSHRHPGPAPPPPRRRRHCAGGLRPFAVVSGDHNPIHRPDRRPAGRRRSPIVRHVALRRPPSVVTATDGRPGARQLIRLDGRFTSA